jgi:hypothetical protein
MSGAYGTIYYNDTYMFFDDNSGSLEMRGFKNGDLFVVRRQQFTWKRNKDKIIFYITDATRYDVASGSSEKDTQNMYTTSTTKFRFEGNNILLFLGGSGENPRYVRQ